MSFVELNSSEAQTLALFGNPCKRLSSRIKKT
jgi:hypothetical protein